MYNAEKYIANCLDSILNSDLPKDEYEVIVVNDGSTDRGPGIVQAYASLFPNFLYLTQDNQGQGVARNYGIREANGEYLWCIDSDDQICNNVLFLFDLIRDYHNIDIIETKMIEEQSDGTINYHKELDNSIEIFSGAYFIINGYWPASVCTKLMRKQFLTENNLFFLSGIVHEDSELSYRLYAYADLVLKCNRHTYIYRYNYSSTDRSKEPHKILKGLISNIALYKSFEELASTFERTNIAMSTAIRKNGRSILIMTVLSLLTKKRQYKKIGIHGKLLEEIKKQGVYPLKDDFFSLKKNFVAKMLNIEFLLK